MITHRYNTIYYRIIWLTHLSFVAYGKFHLEIVMYITQLEIAVSRYVTTRVTT